MLAPQITTLAARDGISLDVDAQSLALATVSGTIGNLRVHDLSGGLTVAQTTTGGGELQLSAAAGNLTVTNANAASGAITFTTTGSGNILVDGVVTTGDLTISAAGAIDSAFVSNGVTDLAGS